MCTDPSSYQLVNTTYHSPTAPRSPLLGDVRSQIMPLPHVKQGHKLSSSLYPSSPQHLLTEVISQDEEFWDIYHFLITGHERRTIYFYWSVRRQNNGGTTRVVISGFLPPPPSQLRKGTRHTHRGIYFSIHHDLPTTHLGSQTP